ncbi:hypothetical protein Glove_325g32 [Diversispora epigaea]|uniref:Uncharacterized protein n=1 Tax=Diversispora epigaea TaxID=1348612 RepID=A0A397HMX6_9GLOM|nr:hypothetical protein Glove_325g32 [Diversispora epigaea]
MSALKRFEIEELNRQQKSKNENDDQKESDELGDVNTIEPMLPTSPILKLQVPTILKRNDSIVYIEYKIDELLNRIEMMKKYQEQRRQKRINNNSININNIV